ncbi:hypothetical protein LINPERPRIM_LOCUS38287 [Linum perenne]
MMRDWSVSLTHIFIEANCSADFLVSRGHDCQLGVHSISPLNYNLSYFINLDCMGISTPRLVYDN